MGRNDAANLATVLRFELPKVLHSTFAADLWAGALLVFFGPGATGVLVYSRRVD